jgi:hypothetical protein
MATVMATTTLLLRHNVNDLERMIMFAMMHYERRGISMDESTGGHASRTHGERKCSILEQDEWTAQYADTCSGENGLRIWDWKWQRYNRNGEVDRDADKHQTHGEEHEPACRRADTSATAKHQVGLVSKLGGSMKQPTARNKMLEQ